MHFATRQIIAVSVFAAFVLFLFVVTGRLLLPGGSWETAMHAQANEALKYTGAASCGASGCHGSTKPKPDYPKLNESLIWFEKDQHAQAYATLTNERLKSGVSPSKIAKNLKIAKAETSARCLSCHAVNVNKALRGPKFDITEGVHCDGCHGPAEKWLEAHAEKGWTHEKSVELGMYDTKNLRLRAGKCVSCHLAIDQELVAAGHPDLLAFELDSFSADMPPHWRDKGTWFGTRAWATGQAIALREAMKQLADRAGRGASEKLLVEAWQKARGHAAVFRHAIGKVSPDEQKALDQDMATLRGLMGKAGENRKKIAAAATKVVKAIDQLVGKVATKNFDKANTQALIKVIAGDGKSISGAGLFAAEQAAMALDRLYLTYSKAPGSKSNEAVLDALDQLFADLEEPEKFNAKQFASDMKAFQQSFK